LKTAIGWAVGPAQRAYTRPLSPILDRTRAALALKNGRPRPRQAPPLCDRGLGTHMVPPHVIVKHALAQSRREWTAPHDARNSAAPCAISLSHRRANACNRLRPGAAAGVLGGVPSRGGAAHEYEYECMGAARAKRVAFALRLRTRWRGQTCSLRVDLGVARHRMLT